MKKDILKMMKAIPEESVKPIVKKSRYRKSK